MVLGHEFKNRLKNLELDVESYTSGTFHPRFAQPLVDVGARYKLKPPFILLLMAGRSAARFASDQPHFVGYFGVQVLLPKKPFESDTESVQH